jgi:hypothetical protein
VHFEKQSKIANGLCKINHFLSDPFCNLNKNTITAASIKTHFPRIPHHPQRPQSIPAAGLSGLFHRKVNLAGISG